MKHRIQFRIKICSYYSENDYSHNPPAISNLIKIMIAINENDYKYCKNCKNKKVKTSRVNLKLNVFFGSGTLLFTKNDTQEHEIVLKKKYLFGNGRSAVSLTKSN